MLKSLRYTATAGFAMFSMFFGSGNLVFPLIVGLKSIDHYQVAFMGLFLTAVLVPFLGLITMVLFDGNRDKFFESLGKWPAFVITFVMLLLMGPLGIVPRCITVAYGGLALIFPSLSFVVFSIFFCICIGLMILSKYHVVDIIGVFLTPIKLGMILFLILAGLYFAPSVEIGESTSFDSFYSGIMYGYQTMDLIAAFFFSATTVHYLRKHIKDEDPIHLIKGSLLSCCIGGALLTLAYLGFVSLGASYSAGLQGVPSESLLVAITGFALGKYAMPFVGLMLAVACLATAVIVTTLFSEFLQKDISRGALPKLTSVSLTLVATFFVSLLGFDSICQILDTVLKVAYPAFIVYTLFAILKIWTSRSYEHIAFWIVLSGTLVLWFL